MDDVETVAISYDMQKKIAGELSDFSVSLVIPSGQDEQQNATLGGSGTLVHAGGRHAILTADHVLEDLPTSGEVGLVLPSMYRPQLHRFMFPMAGTKKITIARGTDPCECPDLALLIFSEVTAKEIDRNKVFYNLAKRKDWILSNPPSIDLGFWYLCGMPGEWTKDLPPEKGFQKIKQFGGTCAGVNKPNEEQRGEFDYLKFDIEMTENYDGPKNFNCMSGGGLWHIIFERSELGEPVVKDKILSGVAFCQDLESSPWTITCHGRKGICGAVVDALEKGAK